MSTWKDERLNEAKEILAYELTKMVHGEEEEMCIRDSSAGVGSSIFAVASVVAIITMHDAMGVRHETGEQAKVCLLYTSGCRYLFRTNEAPGKLYRGRTAAGRCLFAGKASAAAETDPDRCSGGGNTMKPELSELRCV